MTKIEFHDKTIYPILNTATTQQALIPQGNQFVFRGYKFFALLLKKESKLNRLLITKEDEIGSHNKSFLFMTLEIYTSAACLHVTEYDISSQAKGNSEE